MIRFKSYKNNNVSVNFQDLVINSPSLATFFQDLITPSAGSSIEFSAEAAVGKSVEYKISNDGTVKVLKDNNITSFKNFLETLKSDFFILLSPELLSSRLVQLASAEQLKQTIVNLPAIPVDSSISSQIESEKSKLDELIKKIEGGFNAEQKDKQLRLTELNSRLASIQAQIDSFQGEKKAKDEINTSIKKLTQDKTNINQMLESVELLIKTREELRQKVLSYNHLSQEEAKINELKQKKLQFQNSILFSKKPVSVTESEDFEDKKKSLINIELSPILILAFLNVAVSILAFLYSYSFSVLIVAVVSTVLIMITYLISRFFSDSLEGVDEDKDKVEKQELAVPVTPNSLSQEDPNSQIFINAAWVNALSSELSTIEQNIQKNLNGKSYESMKSELQEIDNSLTAENKKLTDLTEKSITSDEYYKKRREADILKIERENLEFSLKIDPILNEQKQDLEKTLKELKEKQTFAQNTAMQLPIFVSSNIEKGQFFNIKHDLLNQLVLVQAI